MKFYKNFFFFKVKLLYILIHKLQILIAHLLQILIFVDIVNF